MKYNLDFILCFSGVDFSVHHYASRWRQMSVFYKKSLAASKYALQSKYLFKITTFSESMQFSTQWLPSLLKRFIQKQSFFQKRNKRVTVFPQAIDSITLIQEQKKTE